MLHACKKLFTGLWAATVGAIGSAGDWLLNRNSIARAECELEAAMRKQDSDKLFVARMKVRAEELRDKELADATWQLNQARAAYNKTLRDIQGGLQPKSVGLSALRYLDACKAKKDIIERYAKLLDEQYAKALQVLVERCNMLESAKYELETLRLKKELARTGKCSMFGEGVDEALRSVRRLIHEQDALEQVELATAPAQPEESTASRDQELQDKLDKDLADVSVV